MWKSHILPSAVLLALAITALAQSAYAEPFPEIEKGADYTREKIGYTPEGGIIYNWSSSPARIFDGVSYHDYILTQTDQHVKIETVNAGSLIFDKNTCSYTIHSAGFIDELNPPKVRDISWTVKGKAAASSTWNSVNTINNAACVVTVQTTESTVRLIGEKSAPSGIFQIVLDYEPGRGIKETFRAYNNNPAWSNHNIGFTETFKVPPTIQFGGTQYDLAQHNNTVLSRTWIENNEAKLVRLSDNILYDFGIGFDNLNDIKIMWDGQQASLALNYLYPTQTVPYQTWFEVDPTFGPSTSIKMKTIETNVGTGATCAAVSANNTDNIVKLPGTADNTRCKVTGIEFNLATIPIGVAVTDADITVGVNAPTATSRNCDITKMNVRLTTSAASSIYSDITSATSYVSDNNFCTTAGSKNVDLGTTAESDLANSINSGQDWVSYGIRVNGNYTNRPAATSEYSFTTWSLTIQYVFVPPNPPTGFSAESQARKVQYSWTQTNGSNVITYYHGRSLDNATWTNKTNVGNVTSYLDSAYYRPGLLYYANVTASNGLNSTSAYTSFTMDGIPSAPQNLARTLPNGTSVQLTWTAPTSTGGDAISGYRIEVSTSSACTSFSILANNSAALNYNHTGLSTTQQYCYRVAAWNGVDMSPYSGTVLRFLLPNAVTDLQTTTIGINNIDIAWTQPGLNGGTLLGYRINYTTPSGTPNTILVNNTNSSSTAYSITGLADDTAYCMRVGAWTYAGNNGSGNIACATTFGLSNFTIGFFDVNQTNSDVFPIRFERTEVNASATQVKVIYPNTADLDCTLDFTIAQDTLTYNNINGSTYDSTSDSEDFVFAGSLNDIVNIHCMDSNTNDTGIYVLQQQGDFVLLDMIRGFRNGDYGTSGMFGALDLITMVVVITSMIGFNRVNEAVGAVFNSFLIGTLAWFEIITFPTIMFGALFIIVLLAYLNTRKD